MIENLNSIKEVALGLGELNERVAFVGGSVVSLYSTSPAASTPRPTLDVDCVIEIASRVEYAKLETVLRRKKFRNDFSEGAPRCRWKFYEHTVDIMATDSTIMGFNSAWYKKGLESAQTLRIDNECQIRIFTTPYFLATKFEAFYDRGKIDSRTSKDLEDIVYILINRSECINEINASDSEVKQYLIESFSAFAAFDNCEEIIASVLPRGEPVGTIGKIREIFQMIATIC